MLKKIIVIFASVLLLANSISAEEVILYTKETPKAAVPTPVIQEENYKEVSPLELVNAPHRYLNKDVKLLAKFDKFSTIGLDYPPVKRDAKTYISFLIKRENVTTYNIPLSELKLIIKRDYAEKEMVNIEQGDKIEIYGNVFSNALGDPWVDVQKIKILTKKEKKDNKEEVKK